MQGMFHQINTVISLELALYGILMIDITVFTTTLYWIFICTCRKAHTYVCFKKLTSKLFIYLCRNPSFAKIKVKLSERYWRRYSSLQCFKTLLCLFISWMILKPPFHLLCLFHDITGYESVCNLITSFKRIIIDSSVQIGNYLIFLLIRKKRTYIRQIHITVLVQWSSKSFKWSRNSLDLIHLKRNRMVENISLYKLSFTWTFKKKYLRIHFQHIQILFCIQKAIEAYKIIIKPIQFTAFLLVFRPCFTLIVIQTMITIS